MSDNKIIITVLVVTYNSDLLKTKQTLLSIIKQEDVEFEIIIADDGSINNNFDLIRSFFIEQNFSNYKLVDNTENQGTVKNIISGLNAASGDFIKLISPGDFFYSKKSLKMAQNFIIQDNKEASAYFGRTIFYTFNDNRLNIQMNHSNPHDIRPYLFQNEKKIKKNYFIRLDTILGASVIYKIESLKRHLLQICDFVKFAEDYSMISMLANNEKIKLILDDNHPNFFIWYESDTGISTQKQSKWHKILHDELEKTLKNLCDNKLISPHIYMANFSTSKFKRFFFHIIFDPLFYITNKFKKANSIGWNNSMPDTSFISHLLEV